jgi:2-polyprenyl-3-methyl-5-hydroxy-6-metoxy-1,4-benzoquinol methylase
LTSSYEERLKNALAEQHGKCFDPEKKALKHEYAEYIDCPVCGSSDGSVFFTKDWFTFSRCGECSMVYLNPRLNDQATYAFYNSDWNAVYNETKFDTASTSTALDDKINASNLRRILQARRGALGRLLEIGCGAGFFLREAKAAGFEVHGLELNEKNVSKVREQLGPTILNIDLFKASYPAGHFDVIYMRDVFEHVPHPNEMLRELNRIAKPGALLFIEVPNIEGLIYKLVQERHVCIFGFEHLNYWSPATLERILASNGFESRRVFHSSLDFTVGDVVASYVRPSFTTLYPREPPKGAQKLLRALDRLCSFTPVRYLDKNITPALANVVKRGSVVKVLAEKARDR